MPKILLNSLIILIVSLFLLIGCNNAINNNDNNNNPMEITITETTVGEIDGYSVGISSIYEDDDGVVRATISYCKPDDLEEKEASVRLSKGETLQLGYRLIMIKSIYSPDDKRGSITLSW